MKKLFLLFITMMVMFSVTVVAQSIDVSAEDPFERMGLRVDFGDPTPIAPFGGNMETPEPRPVGGGFYAVPIDSIPQLTMPGIHRHSQDVEINITEDDLEILLDFVYTMLIDGKPVGFDAYFVSALEETGLYYGFFSGVYAKVEELASELINSCPDMSEVMAERARLIEDMYVGIAPLNIFTGRLSNFRLNPRELSWDRSFQMILNDRLTYSISFFSVSTSNSMSTGYMQVNFNGDPQRFWGWPNQENYTISPAVHDSEFWGRIVIVPGNHHFAIRNNNHSGVMTFNGTYTVRW